MTLTLPPSALFDCSVRVPLIYTAADSIRTSLKWDRIEGRDRVISAGVSCVPVPVAQNCQPLGCPVLAVSAATVGPRALTRGPTVLAQAFRGFTEALQNISRPWQVVLPVVAAAAQPEVWPTPLAELQIKANHCCRGPR